MQEKNIKYKRGVATSIDLIVPNDLTNREIIFTVKENKTLTANRIIEKKKTLNQITAYYNADKNETTVSVNLIANDTHDLQARSYPFDVDSISLTNALDIKTPLSGDFILDADVRTPFDGVDLPANAKRFVAVMAENFANNDVIRVEELSGAKTFTGIQVYTKTEVDALLNLELNESAFSTFFDNRLATKTLDDIDQSVTRVHLTQINLTKLDSIEAGAQVNTVTSVAGRVGAVVLTKVDVGLTNVDNTTDLLKPISTATQTALDNKANIFSPVFLGNVTGLGVSTGTSFNSITGLSDLGALAAGVASAGTSTLVARADHTHPAQTSIIGNAATATALQTARTINGVSFDGSANITVTSAASTLTGTTLASNVLASSLTSVGNITAGTWSGLFGVVSGANLTNLTAANISAGIADISITGNAATVTTNANLTGIITSVGNATSVASQTGTGSTFVMNTSPVLVTPNIGAATALSLNATGTTGFISSPYAIVAPKTLVGVGTGILTSIGTVAAGARPDGVAVDPTGRFVYVTNFNSNNVQAYSINQSTGVLTSLGTVATGSTPVGVVVDPTGRFVYVANYSSNTVQTYSINQSTGVLTSLGTVATETQPNGVAVDPTGRFVYVVNLSSNTVQAYTINQSTGALTSIGTVAAGASPYGVAVDPTGRFAYVTNQSSNTVQTYTINQSTGALTSIGTVAAGARPIGVAVDPTGRFVYVTNFNSNNVQAYSINNFSAGVGVFTNVGLGMSNTTFQLQLSTDSAAKPVSNTWTISSDERLKTNIQSFNDGLGVLTQINPVSYELNNLAGMPGGAKGIGVIAQSVKDIIPYTISTFFAKLNPEDEEDTELYSFNSSALQFVAINAIKELNSKINNLAKFEVGSSENPAGITMFDNTTKEAYSVIIDNGEIVINKIVE